MEFLPELNVSQAVAATPRVIPDIRFQLERMREIDAGVRFSGKQLKTAAGDLGGVSFALSLEQQKLSLDEFLVRGWAGARVEASGARLSRRRSPGRLRHHTWRLPDRFRRCLSSLARQCCGLDASAG